MTREGPELNPHNPVYLKCRYVWCVPIGLLISRALWGLFKNHGEPSNWGQYEQDVGPDIAHQRKLHTD